MDSCIRIGVAVAVFALGASEVRAGGGLLQTLPKDGSWVKYYVELKISAQPKQDMTGILKLSSVGHVAENGQDCRWIEIDFRGEQNGMKNHQVLKLLLREKHLKADSKAVIKPVRGYMKDDDGKPTELADSNEILVRLFTTIVAGRAGGVKPEKKATTIDCLQGQLKIAAGETGTLTFKPDENAADGQQFRMTQTLWKHKNVPFGVAAMRLTVDIRDKQKSVQVLRFKIDVQDYGTKGAASALPNQN
jgi:hypothetical protein